MNKFIWPFAHMYEVKYKPCHWHLVVIHDGDLN